MAVAFVNAIGRSGASGTSLAITPGAGADYQVGAATGPGDSAYSVAFDGDPMALILSRLNDGEGGLFNRSTRMHGLAGNYTGASRTAVWSVSAGQVLACFAGVHQTVPTHHTQVALANGAGSVSATILAANNPIGSRVVWSLFGFGTWSGTLTPSVGAVHAQTDDFGSSGNAIGSAAGTGADMTLTVTLPSGTTDLLLFVQVLAEATGGGGTTHDAAVSFVAAGTVTAAASARRAVAASFAGAATVSPAATVRRRAAAAFTGAGTFAGAATARRGAAVQFAATATLSPTARLRHAAGVAFQGVATFGASVGASIIPVAIAFTAAATAAFTARGIRPAAVTFSGAATVTGSARRILGVAASYVAVASLTPTARAIRAAVVAFSGAGTFSATVEAEAEAYQGKYAAEHAGALAAVAGARGFGGEHASALSAVRGAGR